MNLRLHSLHSPGFAVVLLAWLAATLCARADETWVATWATAVQVVEPKDLPPAPGFGDVTLRQNLRVSLGGKRARLTLSNEYGRGELELGGVSVATPAGDGAIRAGTARALTFSGAPGAVLPPGRRITSDPFEIELAPLADLAVSLHVLAASAPVTGHPGSRTTSFLAPGGRLDDPKLAGAARVDRWYFLAALEVEAAPGTPVVVTLGDSITDGRGSTTNGNDRWPDQLARRLQAEPATRGIALVNQGIGGNRVLGDGLGPSALKRFERDVLGVPGVQWVIVLEGINDLGGAAGARAKGLPAANAADLIAAYTTMIDQAHARGVRVIGGTIPPFEGAFYFSPEGEADRQTVNAWIREGGKFDGVVDFDAALRDPAHPTRLAAAAESTDALHPGPGGYRRMAEAVDLRLFAR